MAGRKKSESLEQLEPQLEQAENLVQQRIREPKKVIQLVIDAGRSSIKYQAFTDSETGTPARKIDSLVCPVSSTPFGELGAFSMSRAKGEDGKDLVEQWVVGSAAKLQGKEFISMTDGDNHKVTYFPILCLGAIASLPNLYELSTGTSPRRRSLHINLSTLSLADPTELKKGINACKWIIVDGIRYRLTFVKNGFLHFPEGYGASLWMQPKVADDKEFLTFDIGFGTATVSQYSNYGKLPKRVAASPNGGGGVATLVRKFSKALRQGDSSDSIEREHLREMLETATIAPDGKVSAFAPDGKDVGEALKAGISAWIQDSALTDALADLSIKARRNKVALCGGGFAIKPVQQMIRERLASASVPDENLLLTDNPETIALSQMKQITGESTNETFPRKNGAGF
ncbi:MAG: hypothetical protein C6Y22_08270 [Hapalosiphonaceae cyanobacterium JJU2]|nr:MAG: hypothetical protein C6Y22_08270 [Hapalosiphonaceae cyanobacterium JJU2]